MAKSKTTSKIKSAKNIQTKELSFSFLRKIYTFIDVQMKRIVGLIILSFCLFLVVSFISYISTWKIDQNQVLNQDGLFSYLFHDSQQTANAGGKLGAYLSHYLIYQGFGIATYLLLPFLALWGTNLLLRTRIYSTLKNFFYTSLLLILISPVVAHFIPKSFLPFPYAGSFGEIVSTKITLLAGPIATSILMLGMGLLAIILFFTPLFQIPAIKQLLTPKPTDQVEEEIETEHEAKLSIDESQDISDFEVASNQSSTTLDDLIAEHEHEKTEVQTTPLTEEQVLPLDEEQIQPFEEKPEEEIHIENSVTASIPLESHTHEIELEPSAPTSISTADTSIQSDPDFTIEVVKVNEDHDANSTAGITVATDEPYDPSLELRNYKFPTIDLLEQRNTEEISIDKNELEQNKNQIINTLKSFGIAIAKISATVGPTVTLYEIVPAEGVRISKIRNLEDDIALSLSALGIRIIAPIPGKGTIGIEVPNIKKQFVSMRTLLASEKFIHNDFGLPIALGKKIDNENYIVDLAKMPHLLMAGATGQGKSVGINTILVSLLYKKHPSQLKFVMVDPKKVELSIYKHIEKHFLAKLPNEEEAIITDTKKVINTLNALCIEMDNRYDLLKDAGVRNIREYNEKFIKRKLLPTKGHMYLPFIVLVVDEFADLIMTAGKEVEMPIARIAQLARAVGIHCIIATQRPSVNVITGTIKANFPARVAFKVSAKVDSRTILDAGGAEQLIGQGDMLILNGSELVRLQCAFVDTPEVERIVEFIGNQQGYPTAFDLPEYEGADGGDLAGGSPKSLKEVDQMFEQCARLVVTSGSGSTSMLQRRFNLGYNRAGRIMDQLEAAGIVGASIGGKPRELMVHTESELDEILRAIGKL
jgi:S-DNA-T family DNA segregation ATPase FtsK/SpoIIIE